jgi:hypothetical protein
MAEFARMFRIALAQCPLLDGKSGIAAAISVARSSKTSAYSRRGAAARRIEPISMVFPAAVSPVKTKQAPEETLRAAFELHCV